MQIFNVTMILSNHFPFQIDATIQTKKYR